VCVIRTCWYKITVTGLSPSSILWQNWIISSFKNKCYENQGKFIECCSTIVTQGFTGGEGMIFREVSWGSASGNKFTNRMACSCMDLFFALLCLRSVCKSNILVWYLQREIVLCVTRGCPLQCFEQFSNDFVQLEFKRTYIIIWRVNILTNYPKDVENLKTLFTKINTICRGRKKQWNKKMTRITSLSSVRLAPCDT